MNMTDINELRQAAAIIERVAARMLAENDEPVKLETVRAVLVAKSQQGHTAEIRELLKKYNSIKLTEVDPRDYAALMADAEAIEDASE